MRGGRVSPGGGARRVTRLRIAQAGPSALPRLGGPCPAASPNSCGTIQNRSRGAGGAPPARAPRAPAAAAAAGLAPSVPACGWVAPIGPPCVHWAPCRRLHPVHPPTPPPGLLLPAATIATTHTRLFYIAAARSRLREGQAAGAPRRAGATGRAALGARPRLGRRPSGRHAHGVACSTNTWAVLGMGTVRGVSVCLVRHEGPGICTRGQQQGVRPPSPQVGVRAALARSACARGHVAQRGGAKGWRKGVAQRGGTKRKMGFCLEEGLAATAREKSSARRWPARRGARGARLARSRALTGPCAVARSARAAPRAHRILRRCV